MTPSGGSSPTDGAGAELSFEDRRWLHDKYERLASQEAELAASRTSYYAAIGTVLITGLLVALADMMNDRLVLQAVVSFLAGLGILISLVWAILLHRTIDAQNLWRDAARRLEEVAPPIVAPVPGVIPLRRTGASLDVDLARPYTTHARRFAPEREISWMDRRNPSALTEILPITFVAIWCGVLAAVWLSYLGVR